MNRSTRCTRRRSREIDDIRLQANVFAQEFRESSDALPELVHGDFSPKNILIHENRLVLLDHEVIHWGDPAFDVAFCLKHFFLKCLWTPAAGRRFLGCYDAMTYTISNMVTSLGAGWHLLTAAAFLSFLVPMIIFFAMQRFFVRGLLGGAVKG